MIVLNNLEITLLVALVIVSILLLVFAIFYFRQKDNCNKLVLKVKDLLDKNNNLNENNIEKDKEIAVLRSRVEYLSPFEDRYKTLLLENQKNSSYIEKLKAEIEFERKNFEDKFNDLQQQKELLKNEFKNLANDILESTKDKMQKESKDTIGSLLNPLKTELSEFKDKIEYLSKEEAKEISALQNELKNLKELSFRLSEEAQSLTNALKGDNKKQGIWGEIILSRVLDLSGLREGIEYKKEVSLKTSDGKMYRPDVVVYLPNSREVIIDSKTSLVAYKNYIEADGDLKKSYLKAHITSIKRHIDILSEKKYEKLEGINSLDFVFIFIPIENALMSAFSYNSDLFEYAFKKRVILVSPTTLLVSLRAIESSWRYERQTKNIAEVIKNAESLYDKVRGFLEDFNKVGKSLDNASSSFENAKLKLTTGKGNLIRQIELLKEKADIKPKKEIPKEFLYEEN